jgi:hypothetical protein
VVNALDFPPAILHNESRGGHSLLLDLVGRSPRQPFGTRVRARVAGHTLIGDLPGGGSYLSASDRRIYLGLGDSRRVDRLEIVWPSGRLEFWNDLEAGAPRRLEEGTGRALQ